MGGVWAQGGYPFPTSEPERIEQWHELVDKYLQGARRAAEWGESLDGPGDELDPGWRVSDILASLAVHDAYPSGSTSPT